MSLLILQLNDCTTVITLISTLPWIFGFFGCPPQYANRIIATANTISFIVFISFHSSDGWKKITKNEKYVGFIFWNLIQLELKWNQMLCAISKP